MGDATRRRAPRSRARERLLADDGAPRGVVRARGAGRRRRCLRLMLWATVWATMVRCTRVLDLDLLDAMLWNGLWTDRTSLARAAAARMLACSWRTISRALAGGQWMLEVLITLATCLMQAASLSRYHSSVPSALAQGSGT
jgi:hypothetical protein